MKYILCVLQWIEENYNATTMFITGKFTCQVIDKGLQKPEYIDLAIISAVYRHLPACLLITYTLSY